MSAPTLEKGATTTRGRLWSARGPLLVGAGILAATVALRLRDPHDSGSWGGCPLRAMTGLDCPMCGGLRATNDLTHGDLGAALHSNLLFVGSIPLLVALWGYWLWSRTRTAPSPPVGAGPVAMRWVAAYGVVTVLFTIWRNTPWGHAFWA